MVSNDISLEDVNKFEVALTMIKQSNLLCVKFFSVLIY